MPKIGVLSRSPYKNVKKVYGPYTRKDGRMHVLVYFNDDTRTTVSYPKYYMECKLGRFLSHLEEVHHKDEDETNNHPSNFEILDRGEHRRYHSTKYHNDITVVCVWCKKEFILTPQQQSSRVRNSSRVTNGPFCSRSCRGKSKLISGFNNT